MFNMLKRNWLAPLAAGCLLMAAVAAYGDEPQTYTLTYKADGGGKLKIDTVGGTETLSSLTQYEAVITEGEQAPNVKITAVSDNGYRFVAWNDALADSVRYVEDDAALLSNKTFTAVFVKTYPLTYKAGANGKIRAGEDAAALDSLTVAVDSNTHGPTVTAVPDNGYHFVSWNDGGTDPEHVVKAVTSARTITAAFEINTYTLTYTAEAGGKLQVGGADAAAPYTVSLTHGLSGPAVTAVPDNGYRFVEWSDGKTAASRTDTAVTNISFTAAFAVISTIKISSFNDLKKIGSDAAYPLNGSYELTADIDASASRDGGAGFKPIGFVYYYNINSLLTDRAFTGKFYGNGKTIRGLYINRPQSDSGTGLFGYARGAEIKNVALVGAEIKGGGYVGALVGRAYKSTVSGCRANGSVSGDSLVGGLAGAVDTGGGTVTASYSSAAVSGKNIVGGLVGSNGMSGKIIGCYSTGTVSGSGSVAGGLVGYNDFEISDSYSTAAVRGKSKVGGFAGESHYNKMSVIPVTGMPTIRQCYSAGSVSGESSVGGFVGVNENSSALWYCNWDIETSGQTGAGSGAGASVNGKTTAEMSAMGKGAIIAGWDRFGASWGVSNSYPYLLGLPTDTAVFTAVTQGSKVAAGRVSGKSELSQIVNRGVGGVPVAASVRYYKDYDMTDSVQVGDSLVGWFADGKKIADGINDTFTADVSGSTLALSELGGNVDVEARFALKKYTVTYMSRIRANGENVDSIGGKIKVTTDSAAAKSVSVTIEYGAVVAVEAVPDPGYRFRRWGNNPDDSVAVRADTVKGPATFYAMFAVTVSVLTPDRNIPQIKIKEEAVTLPPTVITAGELTAGPNPIAKPSGTINFYRHGRQIADSELRVYDVTGNVINKIKISDKALNTSAKRIVGSWDLKDGRGRPAAEGTYLVRGTVKTRSGGAEKVSIIIGVR